MRNRARIQLLLARDGVIARREHPDLADTLTWLQRRGELVAVLPGVYAEPGRAGEPGIRVAAVVKAAPEAVFTQQVAARLTFWPELPVVTVTAAAGHDRTDRTDRSGIAFTRRRIPAGLIVVRGGLRLTSPALTALDLVGPGHPDAVALALRRRAVTPEDLAEALRLTAGRPGNAARRRILRELGTSAPQLGSISCGSGLRGIFTARPNQPFR